MSVLHEDHADASSDEEVLPVPTLTMRKRQKIVIPVPSMPTAAHHPSHDASHMATAGYGASWPWMQSPWMPPPPMHAQPWQSGGRPPSVPYSAPWPGSSHMEEVPLLESADRACRRRKRHYYDTSASGRNKVGRKPHQLYVKAGGEIDTSCEGKNAWDDVVRTSTPRILDMSVVEWEAQKPASVALLRSTVDAEFEYVGHTLSMQGFRAAIKKYLKAERSRLKSRFVAGFEDCPIHIDPDQWKKLKTYWGTSPQVAKTAKMVNARAQVKDYSNVGRKGRAGKEALVREGKDRSPGLTEIAQGIQESQARGPMALGATGAVKARVTTLEMKHNAMEEKMTQMLLNQSESNDSLEHVKSMLKKCMERFLGSEHNSPGLSISGVETQPDLLSKDMQVIVGQPRTKFRKPASLVSSAIEDSSSDSDDVKEVPAPAKAKGSTPPLQEQSTEDAINVEALKDNDDLASTATPFAATALVQIGDSSPMLEESQKEPAVVALQDQEAKVETKEGAAMKVLASTHIVEETLNKGEKAAVQNNSATDSKKAPRKGKLLKKVMSTSHEESLTNLKTVVIAGVVETSGAATSRLRSSPRKQKVQPNSPLEVKAAQEEDSMKRTSGKRETKTKAAPNKKAPTQKFAVGQEVLLMNPKIVKQAVASGVISGIGGVHSFHFVTIPESWYKVDVKQAIWPHVQLMFPNLDAEQSKVKDVVGSNAIWDGKYLKLAT